MVNYLKVIRHLEKHLLPGKEDFLWYNQKTDDEIRTVIQDLKLMLNDKPELSEEHQEQLQKLYDLLKKIYSDYKHNKQPKNMSAAELDQYIISVARWFEERYRIVDRNPMLRRLWRKTGRCMFHGKKVVKGGSLEDIKGPAILVSTHDTLVEPALLQSLSKVHIFWVADMYLGHSTTIRIHHWPVLRWFFDAVGLLEVNRKNPSKGLKEVLKKSEYIFEKGGIVGICPLGSTERRHHKWDMFGHGGAIGIAQFSEKKLNIKIPIIPIGVKKEKSSFSIRIGDPIYIDPNMNREQRSQYADYILEKIYELVKD